MDIINPLRKTPVTEKKAAILTRVVAVVLGVLLVGLSLVVSVLGTILQVRSHSDAVIQCKIIIKIIKLYLYSFIANQQLFNLYCFVT